MYKNLYLEEHMFTNAKCHSTLQSRTYSMLKKIFLHLPTILETTHSLKRSSFLGTKCYVYRNNSDV